MPHTKQPSMSWHFFFVAVKTNVGYTAVADFVLQSETAEQIAEALKILSSWNPKRQPPYFMTDYYLVS